MQRQDPLSDMVSSPPSPAPPPPTGRVVAVRGSVIDLAFPAGGLPALLEAVDILWDGAERLIVEVQSHLDQERVRGIALQATSGLARGTPARATGAPLTAPVGEAVLGRLLDVMGAARDGGAPLPDDVPRLPIHRAADRKSVV